jgi:hypothetical protein
VAKVIKRCEEHYEGQDLEMGKVFKWHPDNPESVVVECDCGEET